METVTRYGKFRTWPGSAFGIFLLLAACNRSDQEIKVYRVAKPPVDALTTNNDASMPPNGSSMPGNDGSMAASGSARTPQRDVPTMAVPVPANWETQPLSQMRQASFVVHGNNETAADISFVTLGPAAGNVLDNVNRWLSQLAQPAITADALASTVQQVTTARGNIAVVDLKGEPENGDAKKDGRILAAIASDPTGTAFFKMRGNTELVGSEKENFLKWVRALREMDIPTKDTDLAATQTDSGPPNIKWDVPETWSPGAPSPMRYASFTAGGEGHKVDVSIVTFPGDGGSDIDNVNRWRQQIGLPAVEPGALQAMISPLATNNITFSTVDMAGDSKRTVAGWTRNDGRAWFFKLTGPKEAVEKEKTKFVTFIQSVRF